MRRSVPALLALLGGCVASAEREARERQKDGGYLELRQVVPGAKLRAGLALDSLQRLIASADRAFAASYDAFLEDLRAMDESAALVRARASELRARRGELDARISGVGSEERRAAAVAALATLRTRADAARDAFAPFQAALHDCRAILQARPAADVATSLHEEAARIAGLSRALGAALDGVSVALDELHEELKLAGLTK